jgi:hypothetical protein
MQPYFFPYFQQFRHISQCDVWVVFDLAKYSRGTWINRNRIYSRDCGWTYLTVPVTRGATLSTIAQAPLASGHWRRKILNLLRVYESEAPQYRNVRALVEECLSVPARTIADLNVACLRNVCLALGIATPIHRLSELSLALPGEAAPDEWGLLVSRALGASTYSNATGGRAFFDASRYTRAGVNLEFYDPVPLSYPTGTFAFQEHLSVIDTLMWVAPQALAGWLGRGSR